MIVHPSEGAGLGMPLPPSPKDIGPKQESSYSEEEQTSTHTPVTSPPSGPTIAPSSSTMPPFGTVQSLNPA